MPSKTGRRDLEKSREIDGTTRLGSPSVILWVWARLLRSCGHPRFDVATRC